VKVVILRRVELGKEVTGLVVQDGILRQGDTGQYS